MHDLSMISGSASEQKKEYLGEVIHFFQKINVAEILLQNGDCKVGETLLFTGKKTGSEKLIVDEMEYDHQPVTNARKGEKIAIKTNFRVRKNDKVFKLTTHNQ